MISTIPSGLRSAAGSTLAALLLSVVLAPLEAGAARSPQPLSPSTMAATEAGLSYVAYNEARPVLAYYYAWWNPDTFGKTLYQPGQAYNSDDAAIMQRHVQQAQSAGIDGFVVSWYGVGDRTDKNLVRLLDLGKGSDFRATIHFETPLFWGADDVTAQLRAFYKDRIGHPSIVTYQGRPVIFFWRASKYDNATWSAIRAQVDPNRRAVWLADGDDFAFAAGDAWDGISPYAIAWSANPKSQSPSWGAKAAAQAPRKLYVPPVSPGCDDTAARPATCIQDRAGGAYYQAALDGALASNLEWAVVVSTFNEWMESTQIEPSVQYGDQYLQMTRAFADTYRGTAAAFQPVEPEPAPIPEPDAPGPAEEPAE